MQLLAAAIVIAATFGLCFLVDKGLSALLRRHPQQKSGKAVRLKKRYGVIGILLPLLSVVLLMNMGSIEDMSRAAVIIASVVCLLLGLGIGYCYLASGLFYDGDSFLWVQPGKKNRTYQYNQIVSQQLYTARGVVSVELNFTDGTSIVLDGGLEGVDAFLDEAFAAWCRQKGIDPATCEFHDPDNSCWFPPADNDLGSFGGQA